MLKRYESAGIVGDFYLWWKAACQGVLQTDFFASGHRGQREAGERFRDRANLEYRIAVRRPGDFAGDAAIAVNLSAVAGGNANHQSKILFVGEINLCQFPYLSFGNNGPG